MTLSIIAKSSQFSNIQLELLRLYSHQIDDYDLVNIKHLIGHYFAEKVIDQADLAWQKLNWSDRDMEKFLDDSNS